MNAPVPESPIEISPGAWMTFSDEVAAMGPAQSALENVIVDGDTVICSEDHCTSTWSVDGEMTGWIPWFNPLGSGAVAVLCPSCSAFWRAEQQEDGA